MFKESLYTLLKKEMLADEKQCVPIRCKSLDELLSGVKDSPGVQRGIITELCGPPGSGKTQICMQLCYSAILEGKKAVFIDTNGGFDIDRFLQILELRSNFDISHTECTPDDNRTENFLKKLFIFDPTTIEELVDIVQNQLKQLISENPSITVIAIDSFSFLVKAVQEKPKEKLRQVRVMHEMVSNLLRIAHENNIAVILTNEFTTRFDTFGQAYFIPSLGPNFHHRITQRLSLTSNDHEFLANLEKSKYKQNQIVKFQITKRGVEDL
ncbi:DNA repair protein RAD51 homolog 3-like isoform X2 [Culicoides brevitarsis]|uniref:DNA repair protein RAD51 homolog 3-like isoform X2 n=1 Tax=Culicoides brevitarsis TaxID=469753 RepID=UPI00307B5658